MSEDIKFGKTVYDKNQYEKLVNTSFSQMDPDVNIQQALEEEPTTTEFFEMYNNLFYQIPKEGSEDSHQYLIEQSSEYINFNANQAEIEALQNEIAQLRQQLLDEQKRAIEVQTGGTIDPSSPNQEGTNTVSNSSNTSNSY
jgi:HAMP domain-containing protein